MTLRRKKTIGLGAGGHAKVLLEILLADPTIEILGLLDASEEKWGKKLLGVPILGGDILMPKLVREGVTNFFVGVGSTGNTAPRKAVFDHALKLGLKPLTILHPTAILSPHAYLSIGSCVMAGAIINADAWISPNCCVNTAAVIEHDCMLGRHSFVGPGALLAGGVKVGVGGFVGIGATIRQSIRIGAGGIVGAGAVVIKNVAPRQIVVGVPARPIVHV